MTTAEFAHAETLCHFPTACSVFSGNPITWRTALQIEDVKKLIEEGFPGSRVIVDGDGSKFVTIVVSDSFTDKTMVQQHQMVYRTLGDNIGGEVHALSIQTYTPDEWEKKQGLNVI
ncbi:MAG TPA: BolA/IbaG family iron-sulfur metabolism protein [Gammaproteobacteria bacterium]|nr:BolA/IbaG family iron-sulfur metabolism protein [Gammaproteobacteria bacterium]